MRCRHPRQRRGSASIEIQFSQMVGRLRGVRLENSPQMSPPPTSRSLRTHLRFLAQPGRTLLRPHHSAHHPSGSFQSTADLVKKIDHFIGAHNTNSRPVVWTATADSILQQLTRLYRRISGTEHLVLSLFRPKTPPARPTGRLRKRSLDRRRRQHGACCAERST